MIRRLGKLIFVFLFFSFCNKAIAAEILYCVDELALGFGEKNGIWEGRIYEKRRFKIKVTGAWEEVIFEGMKFSCHRVGEFNGVHPIICKNVKRTNSSAFHFDEMSLRYVMSYASAGGYASPMGDTDNLYAGRCEKF